MTKKDIRDYRKKEFEQVLVPDGTYKPTMKIISTKGETRWLSISDEEVKAIYKLLTK